MSEQRPRRKRILSAPEKFQIWLQLLTGELSQSAAAERYGIDPTTIMRIRKVAREGALAALAASKPGRRHDVDGAELAAAKAEIARSEETVKEQAIELVLFGAGSARAGRPDPDACQRRDEARAAGPDRSRHLAGLDARARLPCVAAG